MWVLMQGPGRTFRQRIDTTIEEHQTKLMTGYSIIGTVTLCDHEGNGGFVSPIGGPSLMAALLEAHGDELLAWLDSKRLSADLDPTQIARYTGSPEKADL